MFKGTFCVSQLRDRMYAQSIHMLKLNHTAMWCQITNGWDLRNVVSVHNQNSRSKEKTHITDLLQIH